MRALKLRRKLMHTMLNAGLYFTEPIFLSFLSAASNPPKKKSLDKSKIWMPKFSGCFNSCWFCWNLSTKSTASQTPCSLDSSSSSSSKCVLPLRSKTIPQLWFLSFLSFRLFHLIKQRFLCCGFCCSMREDVYLVVKAYAAKKETLSPQAQRFVDRLVTLFLLLLLS